MKTFIKKERGFTLIELLVIVAIIALIASIGPTYLVNYQKKGKDARITATMDLLRKTANIIYQSDTNYNKVCCGAAPCNADIKKICDDVDFWNGGLPGIAIYPVSPSQSYCAEVRLNLGNWYCVDSKLISKQYSSEPSCGALNDYTCEPGL